MGGREILVVDNWFPTLEFRQREVVSRGCLNSLSYVVNGILICSGETYGRSVNDVQPGWKSER